MKQPRLSDLHLDAASTKRIRSRLAVGGKAKITINIDKDSLKMLRAKSAETGIPYQRLLNRILRDALKNNQGTESRIDHLEHEIAKLKHRLVA